jgi:GAF domain-containing protein
MARASRSERGKKPGNAADELEVLNEVGTALAAEIDLERAVQVVTDATTRLSGAAFGSFFYNVVDDKGEAYVLFTQSGAPREAFSKFPMPRNTAVFAADLSGGPSFARPTDHQGSLAVPTRHQPT